MALVLYLTWHRSRSSFGLPAILVGGIIAAHVAFWLAGISPAEAQASGWTFQPPPDVSFMLPWSAQEFSRYPWYTLAGSCRQPDRRHLRHRVMHAVQHHRHRGRLPSRSQPRARTQRHRHRQYPVGRARRLYRVHFRQPLRAQLQWRRNRSAVRPDGCGDFGADAGGCADAARLHAEIRARRPADLSRSGPAPPMDHPVAAAAFDRRISVAAGDHRHHRAMGLHRRHPDRRRDRLRDLRIERVADRFHQIQLRRLGISQFAGSLARRSGGAVSPWRQDPGPEPAELPVLRLGQPALPARQDAAAAHPECRFLVFDFKLVTGIDSSAAYSFAQIKRTAQDRGISLVLVHLPPAAEKVLRSSEFISEEVRIVAELDHALEWCEHEIITQHQELRGRKRPACATGSSRFSGPSTTPTN